MKMDLISSLVCYIVCKSFHPFHRDLMDSVKALNPTLTAKRSRSGSHAFA